MILSSLCPASVHPARDASLKARLTKSSLRLIALASLLALAACGSSPAHREYVVGVRGFIDSQGEENRARIESDDQLSEAQKARRLRAWDSLDDATSAQEDLLE